MIDVAGRLDSRYPGGVAGCDKFLSGWELRGGDGGKGVRVPVVVKLIDDELALSCPPLDEEFLK